MKKLIMAIMFSVSALMADGVVVGGEILYGKISSDLTASVPGYSESYSADTKTIAFAAKAGYQFDAVRVMGVLTSEKYKDDMMVDNEGGLVSLGVEADYLIDNIFIGAVAAKGQKDFDGTDIDFVDYGARVGGIFELGTDANLEAGVQYKVRSYDNYNYMGVDLDLEDKIIGVFVGVSFNL